ncbi:hypothetical protein ABZT08_03120 [Streptomyces sp. NPDC005526]|uniref:hypothetical protein n=1 Tax=Streptomyces sp. NPDC005526 TaxID=3156885 RepID=UPI00339DB67B
MGDVLSGGEGWRGMVWRTGTGQRSGTARGRGGRRRPYAGYAVVRAALAAAVLALAAAVPVPPAAAADGAAPYAYADGSRPVTGATTTTDAERLDPGHTYRSSLPKNGKLYYRLDLDATSTAYVSVTAVPRAGTAVAATDGLRVSVQDADSNSCSLQSTRFGGSRSPHPIAAWGARETGPRNVLCRGAGTYYVVVERIDDTESSPDTWPLELFAASEPPLKRTGATRAPDVWDSASPAPVTGQAVDRAGGAGFAGASTVGPGSWRDRIRPGQTLFYRVPVDWGQQLNATAELGSSSGGSGYVIGALSLALYNPVRGYVAEAADGYTGRQASAALAPLPPVAYPNRYGFADQVKAMRFAGSYYLVVHLAAQTAQQFGDGPFGVILRVRTDGAARSAPGYDGTASPRSLFEVTDRDRAAATPTGTAGGSPGLRALAVGGIGTGSLLLAVLGAWTLVARRRAGAW